MADEFRIVIVKDGDDVGGGGSKGGGGVLKFGAALGVGIGLGTSALQVLMSSLHEVLVPVKNLVTGIFKLLGEFLRPIADIAINLLRPILAVVRPMVTLFNNLMRPFIQQAQQFANIAVKAFSTEGSGSLTGMQAMFDSITAILGPFIVASFSVLEQLIIPPLVTLIDQIQIFFTDMLLNIFFAGNPYLQQIKDNYNQQIIDGGNQLISLVNGLINQQTTDSLSQIYTHNQQLLQAFNSGLTDVNSTVNACFAPTGTFVSTIQGGLSAVSNSAVSFANVCIDAANQIRNAMIAAKYGAGATTLASYAGIPDPAPLPTALAPQGIGAGNPAPTPATTPKPKPAPNGYYPGVNKDHLPPWGSMN